MAEKGIPAESEGSALSRAEFSLNHEVYAAVSNSANLQDIKLIGSEYVVRPEVFHVVEEDKMVHGFTGECTDFHFSADTGYALGQYRWTAEIKAGRKKALKLVANYLIAYGDLVGADPEHVEFFFNKVGRFATYPYFRAFFSHHVSETGIVLPPLPSLNERVD